MKKTMSNRTNFDKTKILTRIAILTAIGAVLYKMEIPLMVAHHKIDLSLIPSLVGGMIMGPLVGVLIEFLKGLIELPTSTSAGIGQLINFTVGSSVIIPVCIIYRKFKTKNSFIIGAIISMIVIIIVGALCNYALTPAYMAVLGRPHPTHEEIMVFVSASVLLNTIKGFVTLIPMYFITPILRKNNI